MGKNVRKETNPSRVKSPAVTRQSPEAFLSHNSRDHRIDVVWLDIRNALEKLYATQTARPSCNSFENAPALDLAVQVFGSEEAAREWLTSPNLATDNRPPAELLGTELGDSRVANLLHRIEHGVLA